MLKSRLLLVFCLFAPQWAYAGKLETEIESPKGGGRCIEGLQESIDSWWHKADFCFCTWDSASKEAAQFWEEFRDVLYSAHAYILKKENGGETVVSKTLDDFEKRLKRVNPKHELGLEEIFNELEQIYQYPAPLCQWIAETTIAGYRVFKWKNNPFDGFRKVKAEWEEAQAKIEQKRVQELAAQIAEAAALLEAAQIRNAKNAHLNYER